MAAPASSSPPPAAAAPAAPRASFFDRLSARCDAVDSILCVGLDPHRQDLEARGDVSAEGAFAFCQNLIDLTKHVAACYKPNAAFFEALGAAGVTVQELPHELKDGEPRLNSAAVAAFKAGKIKYVLELSGSTSELMYQCRRAAIDFSVPLVTNVEQTVVIGDALQRHGSSEAVVPRGGFQEGDLVELETYEGVMDLKNMR